MKVKDIATALSAALPSEQEGEQELTGVSIDSRQLKPGHLFIALRGSHYNGNDFLEESIAKGASALIAERKAHGGIPCFVVPDAVAALGRLALFHRQHLDLPLIALTGSNGKTTVKEMIAAILPSPSFATPGNLNNHLGVPLSLLQLNKAHRYGVFELGANQKGDIAYGVSLVRPQVALINNIAPAHIGGFGSLTKIAEAKGEIYEGLSEQGIAVVNEDGEYAHFWDSVLKDKKVLRFSLSKTADLYARDIHYNERHCASFRLLSKDEEAFVNLAFPGQHMVANALAAAAATKALGLSLTEIVSGLTAFKGVKGRLSFLQGKQGSVLIDDTYNANLGSVLTAIDVLSVQPGRRILVLGDMGELGPWTIPHHREVGLKAYQKGIDKLFTWGAHSYHSAEAFGKEGKHFLSQAELAQDLLSQLDENTSILIKGSRLAAMEKIVQQLIG